MTQQPFAEISQLAEHLAHVLGHRRLPLTACRPLGLVWRQINAGFASSSVIRFLSSAVVAVTLGGILL